MELIMQKGRFLAAWVEARRRARGDDPLLCKVAFIGLTVAAGISVTVSTIEIIAEQLTGSEHNDMGVDLRRLQTMIESEPYWWTKY